MKRKHYLLPIIIALSLVLTPSNMVSALRDRTYVVDFTVPKISYDDNLDLAFAAAKFTGDYQIEDGEITHSGKKLTNVIRLEGFFLPNVIEKTNEANSSDNFEVPLSDEFWNSQEAQTILSYFDEKGSPLQNYTKVKFNFGIPEDKTYVVDLSEETMRILEIAGASMLATVERDDCTFEDIVTDNFYQSFSLKKDGKDLYDANLSFISTFNTKEGVTDEDNILVQNSDKILLEAVRPDSALITFKEILEMYQTGEDLFKGYEKVLIKFKHNYTYEITSGKDQSFPKSNIKEYAYTIDGDYYLLDHIELDNTILEENKDYTAQEGSTIITFTEEGIKKLNALNIGSHAILTYYTNGEIVSNTIALQDEAVIPEVPNTLDSITTYILIAGVAMLGITTAVATKIKRS